MAEEPRGHEDRAVRDEDADNGRDELDGQAAEDDRPGACRVADRAAKQQKGGRRHRAEEDECLELRVVADRGLHGRQ